VSKLIGIDYGAKRVGVAVSDETASIAFPKMVLPNDRMLLPTMIDLIRKENASTVIVGDSKDMDGKDNMIMTKVRQFVGDLERSLGITVIFELEYYTSFQARRDTEKTLVDAEAAAIILNSYIERQKNV
jgi:putative Holliday junction resolvase